MPLTADQVKALESGKSHYGCGSDTCKSCYPIMYACAYCGTAFSEPMANGESYICQTCDYDSAEKY